MCLLCQAHISYETKTDQTQSHVRERRRDRGLFLSFFLFCSLCAELHKKRKREKERERERRRERVRERERERLDVDNLDWTARRLLYYPRWVLQAMLRSGCLAAGFPDDGLCYRSHPYQNVWKVSKLKEL
jgi:hypothetical protein